MKKAFDWLYTNAILGGLVWWGTYGGNANALRVAGVFLSVVAALICLATFSDDVQKALARKRSKKNLIPASFRGGYEIFLAGWLIWWGHPVYGLLVLFSWAWVSGLHSRGEDLLKKESSL